MRRIGRVIEEGGKGRVEVEKWKGIVGREMDGCIEVKV